MVSGLVGNPPSEAHLSRSKSAITAGFMDLAIGDDGRIRLPGIPAGLNIASYLPMVHLYASIMEANRILDGFRPQLSLAPASSPQDPLTPLHASKRLPNLYYKREDMTVTKAYKVRGALVGMAKLMAADEHQSFLAVSTGNHALGVLKAASLLSPKSVRIVIPNGTSSQKRTKIEEALRSLNQSGVRGELVCMGDSFDEARLWAQSQTEGEIYLDPYADPWVVAGQGTIGLELFRQVAPLLDDRHIEELVLIAPVGGGGLLTGTATALKMATAWDPRFRHINIRVVGLRLNRMDSALGDAIKVDQVAEVNQSLFEALNVTLLGLDDDHMAHGIQFVQHDLGVLVEGPSAGTTYPALTLEDFQPTSSRLVVSILSGGNIPHQLQ